MHLYPSSSQVPAPNLFYNVVKVKYTIVMVAVNG